MNVRKHRKEKCRESNSDHQHIILKLGGEAMIPYLARLLHNNK